eukprot:TRINITY_DN40139_c0_g1_i1.p1 TRINITY_DN40139_c0_g1~~TRINITY_DN40139_c0_g1_i1.p1  ORF type:complete len:361 (-),score=13.47 TRINITY_DN40139_c0_g1_i1:86-1168(-)
MAIQYKSSGRVSLSRIICSWLLVLQTFALYSLRQSKVYQDCWNAEQTPEICCAYQRPDACFRRFIPRKMLGNERWLDDFLMLECCTTGRVLIEPLANVPAPRVVTDPSLAIHPSLTRNQAAWEARVRNSSFTTGTHLHRHLIFKSFRTDAKGVEDEMLRILSDQYGLIRLLKELPPDPKVAIVLDIGANIGTTVIPLSSLRPDLRFIAFEPNPLAYRYLLWNIRSNRLMNGIWPVFAGISDGAGPMGFARLCEDNSFGCWTVASKLSRLKSSSGSSKQIRVAALTPEMILQYPRPFILKVDCECCEWALFNSSVWRDVTSSAYAIVGEIHTADFQFHLFRSLPELNYLRRTIPRRLQRCP